MTLEPWLLLPRSQLPYPMEQSEPEQSVLAVARVMI